METPSISRRLYFDFIPKAVYDFTEARRLALLFLDHQLIVLSYLELATSQDEPRLLNTRSSECRNQLGANKLQ